MRRGCTYSRMWVVLVSFYNVPLGTEGEQRCESRREMRVSGKQHAPSALPPGNELSSCLCFLEIAWWCSTHSSFRPLFRCRPFYCSSLSKRCIDCVSHLFCTESRSPITAGKGRRPVKSACRRRGHYQL